MTDETKRVKHEVYRIEYPDLLAAGGKTIDTSKWWGKPMQPHPEWITDHLPEKEEESKERDGK
jgi:hypothetical protein